MYKKNSVSFNPGRLENHNVEVEATFRWLMTEPRIRWQFLSWTIPKMPSEARDVPP